MLMCLLRICLQHPKQPSIVCSLSNLHFYSFRQSTQNQVYRMAGNKESRRADPSGSDDAERKQRRKLQNRLNQRARREYPDKELRGRVRLF